MRDFSGCVSGGVGLGVGGFLQVWTAGFGLRVSAALTSVPGLGPWVAGGGWTDGFGLAVSPIGSEEEDDSVEVNVGGQEERAKIVDEAEKVAKLLVAKADAKVKLMLNLREANAALIEAEKTVASAASLRKKAEKAWTEALKKCQAACHDE